MSTGQARVAVIVPCHDDGPYLLEALHSVDEAEPVEIVVVDDHSTDEETKRILASLDSTVIVVRHDSNRGLSSARNSGLAHTHAPFVFPLDADDLAVPGALAEMADRLEQAPDAAVCFGDYLEFGDQELVRAVPERLDPFRLLYVNEYPVTSLFRRSVLTEIGGWKNVDASSGYEDWNLWLSLVERGYDGVHLGPERLTYRRRLHGERMLQRSKRRHRVLYRALRAAHPELFGNTAKLRAASDLPGLRKRLYPIVYGRRRRFAFERKIKRMLDRRRLWTLRR